MKIWKIVALCIVAALLAAPAVSAKEEYTVHPNQGNVGSGQWKY